MRLIYSKQTRRHENVSQMDIGLLATGISPRFVSKRIEPAFGELASLASLSGGNINTATSRLLRGSFHTRLLNAICME
jgi:hypothetical protein